MIRWSIRKAELAPEAFSHWNVLDASALELWVERKYE